MPAPGGKNKGAATGSTGYAGGGSMGVSSGKMGAGSSQTGGAKAAGGKGGQTSGGGKMGASSSQSGGVKGGGGVSGASKGGMGVSSGKMGASSSQTGGVKGSGGVSGSSRGSSLGGGLASAAASASRSSGPGGAGGVRNTSSGTRASQTAAAAMAANNRTANTLAAAQSNLRDPRFADPGVAGVPGGLLGRNQNILGGRLIGVTGGALARTKNNQPFAGMTTPALSQSIAFADHLRDLGYGPLNITSAYRSQQVQDALRAANPLGAAAGRIAKNSDHTLGTAFDASVPGMTNEDLAREALAFGGFSKVMGYGTPRNPQGSHVHMTAGLGPTKALGSVGGQPTANLDPGGSMKVAGFAGAGRPTGQPPGDFGSLGPSVAQPANPSMPALAAAKTQDRLSPNMDMGGYRSPMSGTTGMPQAPSNMDMGGYNSPMAGLSGMPQAPANMNMGGYTSPMAAAMAAAALAGPRNPSSGMSFNPGLPSQMQQSPNMNMAGYNSPMTGLGGMPQARSNMNMAGYNSPMADVGSLPTNPQSAGMSFNPGMPRNPVSGMAFNPGLPAQQQQMAQGIPDQVGREGYDPLSSIRAPQQTTTAQAPQSPGLWGGIAAGLANMPDAIAGAVEQAQPYAKMALDNIDNPLLGPAAMFSRMFSGLGPGAARRDPRGERSARGNAVSLAGRSDKNRKKETNSTAAAPAKLPWETTPTNPQNYPPMPFVPPQMVQRSMPPWLWGSWS